MVGTWTLVAAIIAAVAGIIAILATIVKAMSSLLEKRHKELPKVSLYRGDSGIQFYCHLEAAHDSVGWKIRRVDVKQFEFSLSSPMEIQRRGREAWKCLAQLVPLSEEGEWLTYGEYSESRDFCEWPNNLDLYDMLIDDHCGKALLIFTCEMPFRPWWNLWRKQVKVSFIYEKGEQYLPQKDHPFYRNL